MLSILTNKYIAPIILAGIILLGIIFLYNAWQHEKRKSEDLIQINAMHRDAAAMYKMAGKNHRSNTVAVLNDASNLKTDSLIMSVIKDVSKLKNLKLVSTSTVETRTNINTILKDSITLKRDTLKCIKWSDGYLSLDGCFGDTVRSTYRDTVDQVIHVKRRHKFLFIKWGKRDYVSDMKARNPNSTITSNKTVIIKE